MIVQVILTTTKGGFRMQRLRDTAMITAMVASIAIGAVVTSASLGNPAGAVPTASLGTTYTQTKAQQSVAIHGAPNLFTAVDSSPVLPVGDYTYVFSIDISNVPAGSEVLCGEQAHPNALHTSGLYGVVDNRGGSVAEDGECVLSGAVKITAASTKMSFWATVYTGSSTGAVVTGWSMTETQVGPITFSS
jgi:hypothetical protein